MSIRELLEQEHTKSQCDRIVRYIGGSEERFAELMRLFFSGRYRITQRAAWPLSYCVRQHPGWIRPYFKELLDNLDRKDLHPSVARNTMRILQFVEIPKKFHGRVMSTSFGFVESVETPIAIKAFSLTVLQNLSSLYPDIRGELKLIIEQQWENATPAFRSRARKILNFA
jgi:hypothetical protein